MGLLIVKEKRVFDINSNKDVEQYKKFFTTGSWSPDGCPFILEEPFTNVPEMIKDKLIRKCLKI